MLEIKNLTKTLPGIEMPVLEDVSLSLKKGEFCILLGSYGSGKSSLIKTILGEYMQDSGSIHLGKKDISNLPTYNRVKDIGVVMQDLNNCTIGGMTLLENIVLSKMKAQSPMFKFYNYNAREIHRMLKDLGFGIEKYLYKKVSTLSFAQRQMVAVLMASIHDPEFMIFDEHTSGLVAKSREMVTDFTAKIINESKATTLMVTQNLNDAIEFGDRILIMHQGKIVDDISGREKSLMSAESLMRIFAKIEDGN